MLLHRQDEVAAAARSKAAVSSQERAERDLVAFRQYDQQPSWQPDHFGQEESHDRFLGAG